MTDIMVKKVQDSNKSCCSYSDLFSGSTFSGHSLVCILCITVIILTVVNVVLG